MSVPSTSTTTQPPILVGDAGKSVLPAARVMTSPSVSSTRQYSDETLMTAEALLAISERPNTSLYQVIDTPDPEVILPGELRTVATRLCDPLAVTLPLHHSTPLEPASSHETPVRFGTQQISPVSGQSPDPPVLSPQIPFSQLTLSRIPETLPDSHTTHRPNLPEVFKYMLNTVINFFV